MNMSIATEESRESLDRCREIIAQGGCEVERLYNGPKLPFEDGKFHITHQFVEDMIGWFRINGRLPRRYVWEIVLGAHEHFSKEESLVNIDIPHGATIDIIGDIHGQFLDLLHIYSLTGEPSENHYLLMNGDLVDRGSQSMEVILTALAYKWLYPKYVYINRGNHEADDMNKAYGFKEEAKLKHGVQTYKLFAHVFTTLPLATLVSATQPPKVKLPSDILSTQGFMRYFVVHGGLFSEDEITLDDIRKIERVGQQPGLTNLMGELLWTDPQDEPGRGESRRAWPGGFSFGPDVTKRWCELNNVTAIIRSHEARQAGYGVGHDGLCITVFSAPNYYQGGTNLRNKGAFVRINSRGEKEYRQFGAWWY